MPKFSRIYNASRQITTQKASHDNLDDFVITTNILKWTRQLKAASEARQQYSELSTREQVR